MQYCAGGCEGLSGTITIVDIFIFYQHSSLPLESWTQWHDLRKDGSHVMRPTRVRVSFRIRARFTITTEDDGPNSELTPL
jgi:hypothetical protein